MTTTDKVTALELPASVLEIIAWLGGFPPNVQVEASVYNSFKKDSGRTKVQRLVVRDEH
jgi:hypothetical protein